MAQKSECNALTREGLCAKGGLYEGGRTRGVTHVLGKGGLIGDRAYTQGRGGLQAEHTEEGVTGGKYGIDGRY